MLPAWIQSIMFLAPDGVRAPDGDWKIRRFETMPEPAPAT
jgi:hypothetical protein